MLDIYTSHIIWITCIVLYIFNSIIKLDYTICTYSTYVRVQRKHIKYEEIFMGNSSQITFFLLQLICFWYTKHTKYRYTKYNTRITNYICFIFILKVILQSNLNKKKQASIKRFPTTIIIRKYMPHLQQVCGKVVRQANIIFAIWELKAILHILHFHPVLSFSFIPFCAFIFSISFSFTFFFFIWFTITWWGTCSVQNSGLMNLVTYKSPPKTHLFDHYIFISVLYLYTFIDQ